MSSLSSRQRGISFRPSLTSYKPNGRKHGTRLRESLSRSDIKTREEHDDHGTTTYYSPTLKYAYKADGQSYEGGHIAYNALEYSTRDAANRVVAQLNADGQIPVYYNPGDPQQSVLVRGVLVSDTAYQRMGLYFVFLMTIATTFGLFLATKHK